MPELICRTFFPVHDYDLDATLTSGQAFRWELIDRGWESVIGVRWVRLIPGPAGIAAETVGPTKDWDWLAHYLQVQVELPRVLDTFPADEQMHAAVAACRGLRLLRQDPWECLASFILSSTKQIVQIRQMVSLLCERYGDRVATARGRPPAFSFPSPERLAACSENELRACKMGFRAPYLRVSAQKIAGGEVNLNSLSALSVAEARDELLKLPGVGCKIADCVLLFAYGFQEAFPMDVWVMKALRQLYFRRRPIKAKRLHQFAATHFGPDAGYAQQYLFHYMRIRRRLAEFTRSERGHLGRSSQE